MLMNVSINPSVCCSVCALTDAESYSSRLSGSVDFMLKVGWRHSQDCISPTSCFVIADYVDESLHRSVCCSVSALTDAESCASRLWWIAPYSRRARQRIQLCDEWCSNKNKTTHTITTDRFANIQFVLGWLPRTLTCLDLT